MTCPRKSLVLEAFGDVERSSERAELLRHLAECPECRDQHALAQRIERELRHRPRCPAAPEFTDRLVKQVFAERRSRRLWRRTGGIAAALAASVALVLVVRGSWSSRQAPSPDSSPFAQGGNQRPIVSQPVASVSLNAGFQEAGDALAAWTKRATADTLEQSRLWLPDLPAAPPAPELAALERAWTPPVRSLREAGETLSTGLDPVTVSARRAVDLFLREVPLPADDKPGL